MAQNALKIDPVVAHEPIQIRRFELPDLHQHGGWLIARLLQAYPHLNQQTLWSFLNGLLNNNEVLFLYLPHAVALAQVMRGHTLAPRPIVQMMFVFVENRDDAAQIQAAAAFYDDVYRWAKAQGAEAIVLCELEDVPADKIKGGRKFEKQQTFIRMDK